MVFQTCSTHHVKKLKRKKPVYFCTDMNNEVLYNNFHKRGWVEVSNISGMFNFYWANMTSFRRIILSPSYHLRNDQIVNHFPNSYEFSRKDLLLKHFKNYRKRLERGGDPIAEKLPMDAKLDVGGTRYKYLNFMPQTFILPMEYNMFVEEFNKAPQCTWIIKPSGKSQGIGIFLVNKLIQLKKWAYESRNFYQMPQISRDYYVISKYIENPLLIDQKKFDIRLYVLVTSFNPIKAFLYNEGFCRFCSEKYDKSLSDLTNRYAHLTNVSIQKNNVDVYNRQDGGKCSLENLWDHLNRTFGETTKDLCIDNIINLIRHTLRAVAPVISSDRHCFELYGFDIIIDGRAKPWLIEVNSSPSIVGTTDDDTALKTRLIDNVLKVVLPSSGKPDAKWDKNPSIEASANFIVLINEEASVNYTLHKESHKANKIQNNTIFTTRTPWYSNRSFAGSFRAHLRAILERISHEKSTSISSIAKMQNASIKDILKSDRKKIISASNENLIKKIKESDDKQMFALSKTATSNVIKVLRKKTCRTCSDTTKSKKLSVCLGKHQSKTCKKRLKRTKSPFCNTKVCNKGKNKLPNLPKAASFELTAKSENSGKTQKKLPHAEQDNNERKKSVSFAKLNIIQKNQTSNSGIKVKNIDLATKKLSFDKMNYDGNKKPSDLKDTSLINNHKDSPKSSDFKDISINNNDSEKMAFERALNRLHAIKKNMNVISNNELQQSRIVTSGRKKLLDPENALHIFGNAIKTISKKKSSIARTNNNLNSALALNNSNYNNNNIRKSLGSVGNKKSTQSKIDNKGKRKSSYSGFNRNNKDYTRKPINSNINKKKSLQSTNNKTNRRLSPQYKTAVNNIDYTKKPRNSTVNKKFSHSRIDKRGKTRKSFDSGVIMNTSGYSGKPVIAFVKKKPLCSKNNNTSIRRNSKQSIFSTNTLTKFTRASKVTFEKRRTSYSSANLVDKKKYYVNSNNTFDRRKTSRNKRSSDKVHKNHKVTTKTSKAKQTKQETKNSKRSTTKVTAKRKKINKTKKRRTREAPIPNASSGPISFVKSINVVDRTKQRKRKKKKEQSKPSSPLSSYVFDYDDIHRRTKAFVFRK